MAITSALKSRCRRNRVRLTTISGNKRQEETLRNMCKRASKKKTSKKRKRGGAFDDQSHLLMALMTAIQGKQLAMVKNLLSSKKLKPHLGAFSKNHIGIPVLVGTSIQIVRELLRHPAIVNNLFTLNHFIRRIHYSRSSERRNIVNLAKELLKHKRYTAMLDSVRVYSKTWPEIKKLLNDAKRKLKLTKELKSAVNSRADRLEATCGSAFHRAAIRSSLSDPYLNLSIPEIERRINQEVFMCLDVVALAHQTGIYDAQYQKVVAELKAIHS